MRLILWRCVLDPATSLLARRIRAQFHGRLSYDAAWRLARVSRSPDEMVYRLHGRRLEAEPWASPDGLSADGP